MVEQEDITLKTQGEGITLVYIDSTIGWRSIQDNVFDQIGSNFISATGGSDCYSLVQILKFILLQAQEHLQLQWW